MTDFDPYAQTSGPIIEGMGRAPRAERRRRRDRGHPAVAPPAGTAAPLFDPGDHVDAGFGRRLGAFILDWLIIFIPGSSLSSFVQLFLAKEPGTCERVDGTTYPCDVLTSDSEGIHGLFLLVLLLFIVFFYFGHLEGRRGGTPGKRIAGLRVIRADTGGPIGMGRAIGRWCVRFVSAAPIFLGYLWMLWDDDKQTWHDKVVRSRVVVR
jgi:uncharacterized RDD family membrane protein YckC